MFRSMTERSLSQKLVKPSRSANMNQIQGKFRYDAGQIICYPESKDIKKDITVHKNMIEELLWLYRSEEICEIKKIDEKIVVSCHKSGIKVKSDGIDVTIEVSTDFRA